MLEDQSTAQSTSHCKLGVYRQGCCSNQKPIGALCIVYLMCLTVQGRKEAGLSYLSSQNKYCQKA